MSDREISIDLDNGTIIKMTGAEFVVLCKAAQHQLDFLPATRMTRDEVNAWSKSVQLLEMVRL